MRTAITLTLTFSLLMVGACTQAPSSAPPAAPPAATQTPAAAYTPVVTLNEMMVYVVDTHANELWDAAEKPPTTDQGWRDLQRAAIAVAASGSFTKISGNGPEDQKWVGQVNWVQRSQELADAGLASLAAVRSRDAAALKKAGDQLVVSCVTCHREYKLGVPAIWTERQLPPEEQPR